MLWGHGLRDRHLEGPLAPGEMPVVVVIAARRYLCRACGAVILVVPRGVLLWRHYTAAAIAWALALWGLDRQPRAAVRRRTSAAPVPASFDDPGRWKTLRRWIAAAATGGLFTAASRAARAAAGKTPRQIAAKVAVTVASCANPSLRDLPLSVQAFYGGIAAM